MHYHTVVFDLDGTLLDTLDDLADATNAALRACGYPPRSREEVRRFVGNGVHLLIERAAPHGVEEAAVERCFALFKEQYGKRMCCKTRPYSGILPLLEALREAGVPWAELSGVQANPRSGKVYEGIDLVRRTGADFLLALGGGVCGDLTGFVAATYLRGIDFVQIPTTLLAQADSSIGGKTGVDFDSYKNMVGAFKMPRLVYMNLSVLKTLEERQFYSGFAEVMKSALIKDAPFYEWLIENMYEICERDLNTLEEMVIRTCSIKKMVVEKDPTEQGDRALLNLGHTIGHAIEKYKNFELYHGECVALGTVAAAYISWKKEMLSMEEFYEIRDMFVPFYLPISVENIDPQEILKLTKSDKKMEAGTIKFILLKKIGKAVIDRTVTDEEILAAIEEINFSEEDAHE